MAGDWTLIVGMLARKDAGGHLEAFQGLSPSLLTTAFESPNAAPAEDLALAARAAGLNAKATDGVEAALAEALAGPGPAPHVVICGSLHFMGDILALSPDTWPS